MKERSKPSDLEQELAHYKLLPLFPEPLRAHLTFCNFGEGDLICSQGEMPAYLYVLVKGKIKVYTTSEEGNTLILSFLTPIEVIGDIEYIQGIPIMNTVEAVTPVRMIRVPFRSVNEFGRDHAPLLRFLLKIIAEKFQRKSSSLSFNLLHSVEARLASYLLSVCYDKNDVQFEGHVSLASLKDTANLIGTSYRHLNRVLKKLSAEGLIKRDKGFLQILDREGLRLVAGDNMYE
ncbi:Crp/Fnr family transcriptional regulator [Gorillibacterium timonense]|uniref:Crp/Fnr family transcriptional regulator n=1 Tax=Gorillibacterium timonense TaxID=1689269 RepID=UPI00071C6FC8|nr:Crp/Fnr family transcriptional regulator [Gorillibacterium timonense]